MDAETGSISGLETHASSTDVEKLEYVSEDEDKVNKTFFLFENH